MSDVKSANTGEGWRHWLLSYRKVIKLIAFVGVLLAAATILVFYVLTRFLVVDADIAAGALYVVVLSLALMALLVMCIRQGQRAEKYQAKYNEAIQELQENLTPDRTTDPHKFAVSRFEAFFRANPEAAKAWLTRMSEQLLKDQNTLSAAVDEQVREHALKPAVELAIQVLDANYANQISSIIIMRDAREMAGYLAEISRRVKDFRQFASEEQPEEDVWTGYGLPLLKL